MILFLNSQNFLALDIINSNESVDLNIWQLTIFSLILSLLGIHCGFCCTV